MSWVTGVPKHTGPISLTMAMDQACFLQAIYIREASNPPDPESNLPSTECSDCKRH